MASRIYVIAGHGAGDPGAYGHKRHEADETRRFCSVLKELGGDSVILHDFADNAYESAYLANAKLDCPIIEVHRDAASSPDARGAHLIVATGVKLTQAQARIADGLSAIMPGRSETVVHRSNLYNPNVAKRRGLDYCLVELGFITNSSDNETFDERMADLAYVILNAYGIGYEDENGDTPMSMQCLIKPDGENRMVYFDGVNAHPLDHPDQMLALQMCFEMCNGGRQMPCFEFGSAEAPWAARLFEAASR